MTPYSSGNVASGQNRKFSLCSLKEQAVSLKIAFCVQLPKVIVKQRSSEIYKISSQVYYTWISIHNTAYFFIEALC